MSRAIAAVPDADEIRFALADAEAELRRAAQKFPPFNSAHEGYAILLEEVEELWEVVRQKDKSRDRSALRAGARGHVSHYLTCKKPGQFSKGRR